MSEYDTPLPWRTISARVVALARPERGLQVILVAIGLLQSLAGGLTLTLGLLLVYRVLGVRADGAGEGVAERLVDALAAAGTWTLAATAVAAALMSAVLTESSRIISEVIANRVTHRARASIYAAYLQTTYQKASARGHGAVLDVLDYEAPFLTGSVIHVTFIGTAAITIAFYAAYLVALTPPLGVSILVLGVVLTATLGFASRRLSQLGSRISALNERLLAHTIATVEGMRTIRLHGVESSFIRGYRDASAAVSEAHVRLARSHAWTAGFRQIAKLVVLAAIVGVAVVFHVPSATAILALALLLRAVPLVTDVEERVLSLFNAQLPLSMVCRALDPALMERPSSGERRFDGMREAIRFEDVTFAHEADAPLLRGVSFAIPAGELVTLVGPSGGGKTTLINLLARLYEPQGGSILVDGVPLTELNRGDWLARLGFSGQDIDLTEPTILENIRFHDPSIGEAEAWWALEAVHAADFVRATAAGLHTRVGDRGLRLSGGQRQRIGLARAIARRPDLLILDEATNAVDTRLEAEIYRSIRAALPAATILVITHRTALDQVTRRFALDGGVVTALASDRMGHAA